MLFVLFSIYDRKSGVFLSPFPARKSVDAMRTIMASFKDNSLQGTPVMSAPQDFALYAVGVFDDETGNIDPRGPELVAELKDLRDNAFLGSSTVPS